MQYSSRSFYIAGQVGAAETEVLLVVFRAVQAVSNSKLTVSSSDLLKKICEFIVHNCSLSCNCSILFAQVRTRVFTVSFYPVSACSFSHIFLFYCAILSSLGKDGEQCSRPLVFLSNTNKRVEHEPAISCEQTDY